MNKVTYERMILNITEFDAEDVIVTSGEEPTPTPPPFTPGEYEPPGGTGSMPNGFN